MKLCLFPSIVSKQEPEIQALAPASTIMELSDVQLTYVSGSEGGCRYDARRHEEYCCKDDKNHHRHCYHRHRR